jgi:cation diffusion facilitator CzcD-associated flavoprotein CzcO
MEQQNYKLPTNGELGFDPDALREKYAVERDKRLRKEGNEQFVQINPDADFKHYLDDPYVSERLVRDPIKQDVNVMIIGAGFGGMLTAAKLRNAGVEDVKILEKGGDFGGTWYWNRYPGVQCDIEAYVYLPLLEEVGYMPKTRYSFGPEIFEYCKKFARHFDLYKDAFFQTGVEAIRWNEERKRWIITTDRGDEFAARYVDVSAGPLGRPKLPGIPGIDTFEGHTFHTSRWDYDYTGGHPGLDIFKPDDLLDKLHDKKVAIIGTGATAIQAVTHLGRSAEKLYVIQRTPTSVDFRDNVDTDQELVKKLKPGWQKERMYNFEQVTSGIMVEHDLVNDNLTRVAIEDLKKFLKDIDLKVPFGDLPPADKWKIAELADFKTMERIRALTDEVVKDKDTADKLKAWYRQRCKRPGFNDHYLATFNLPGVEIVDTEGQGPTRFTETSIWVGDKEIEVDCVVFATGFNTESNYAKREGYVIEGRDGLSLAEKWQDRPKTLYGMQTRSFPNLFTMGLIQGGYAFNFTYMLEEQANHIAYVISTALKEDVPVLEVSEEAESAWCAAMDQAEVDFPGRTALFATCTPGYYNAEGTAVKGGYTGFLAGVYAAGAIKFYEMIEEWRNEGTMPGLIKET